MSDLPDIRQATIADTAELARLLLSLGHPLSTDSVGETWSAWTAEGNSALVAEGGSSLLGAITLHSMVVLHRPKPVGRITSLVVDSVARGQGLGRALVRAAEEALLRAGCGTVEVTSHARRTEAHTFYRYLGYEETGLRFARGLS